MVLLIKFLTTWFRNQFTLLKPVSSTKKMYSIQTMCRNVGYDKFNNKNKFDEPGF